MPYQEIFEHWDIGLFIFFLFVQFFKPYLPESREKIRRFVENAGHSLAAHMSLFVLFTFFGVSFKYLDYHFLSKGFISQIELSVFYKYLISFIILDLSVYVQHVAFHKVSFFWRFHQVHHSDQKFSTSLALRFHVGEILLSTFYKMLVLLTFGIPLKIFLIFEAVLFSCSAFNHSNFKFPEKIEKLLRCFLVTPDFHRVHHSTDLQQQNSNFSFSIPLWDHLFKTFSGADRVSEFGIEGRKEEDFLEQLKSPFN